MVFSGALARKALASALAAVGAGVAIAATRKARAGGLPVMTHSQWERTLETITPAILVIRVNGVRSFDGSESGYSFATGFVVDKELGLVLTNRHVVTTGPIIADAILPNKEEVKLIPIYRDPVHDFGFFQLDQSWLRAHQDQDTLTQTEEYRLAEIPLCPAAAKVGCEVRVVGNDDGEELSILSGTLGRLDRAAPYYGVGTFNDYNTFYFGAASNTSGGSSGSPVINIQGEAVALNAGGSNESSAAFYMPLDRVSHALKLLQARAWPLVRGATEVIARGTLGVVFTHETFAEAGRLGLSQEAAKSLRATAATEGVQGVLVVDQVVPGCGSEVEGEPFLEEGDVVVRVHGRAVVQFVPLEALLDDHVGQTIEIDVERGGKSVLVRCVVQDAHTLVPTTFLECGGSVIHPLSWSLAVSFSAQPGSVYVEHAGFTLSNGAVPGKSVILSVDGTATPTLDLFQEVMEGLPHGSRVSLQYMHLNRQNNQPVTVTVVVDRVWHDMCRFHRNDVTCVWDRTPCPPPPPAPTKPPVYMTAIDQMAEGEDVVHSMLRVQVTVPYWIDGLHADRFEGTGVLVHLTESVGLVLVDRNTLTSPLCDIRISYNSSEEWEGHVYFMHPTHNFALIAFDAAPFFKEGAPPTILRPAELSAGSPLRVGDAVKFLGLNSIGVNLSQEASIKDFRSVVEKAAHVPRFAASNEDVVFLDKPLGKTLGGVITTPEGSVKALLLSYSYTDTSTDGSREADRQELRALPVEAILPTLRRLIAAYPNAPTLYSLEAEFKPIQLSHARTAHSLSDALSGRLGNHQRNLPDRNGGRLHVLQVHRLRSGLHTDLQEGDLLLGVGCDGIERSIATFTELEEAVQASGGKPLRVRVLRNRQEVTLTLTPVLVSGGLPGAVVGGEADELWPGTNHLVSWAGVMVQPTYRPVEMLGFTPDSKHGKASTFLYDDGDGDGDGDGDDYGDGDEEEEGEGRGEGREEDSLQTSANDTREGGPLVMHRKGVYVSCYMFGSPAHKYEVYARRWITEVNNTRTPDLPAFLAAVAGIGDEAPVRLKTVDLHGKVQTITLVTDLRYWPTRQLRASPTACGLQWRSPSDEAI